MPPDVYETVWWDEWYMRNEHTIQDEQFINEHMEDVEEEREE